MSKKWTPEEYRQRPQEYHPGLVEEILLRHANGETITEICKDRDMPLRGTFLSWVLNDPELSERYRRAKEIHVLVTTDEIANVAEDTAHDPQRARVMVNARQWQAERLLPAIFGPRAYVTNQTKDTPDEGGIDHLHEVRRRVERMAQRQSDAQQRSDTAPVAGEAG